MTNRNLRERMNELYSHEDDAWGSLADPVIVENLDELRPGSVLDLGSGDGKNSLFLAEEGFDVVAVDFAKNGLSKLLKRAKQKGVVNRLKTIESDIREYDYPKKFDNIISCFTLHFIDKSEAKQVLEVAARNTKEGGMHLLIDFLPIKERAGGLKMEELEEVYSGLGWEFSLTKTIRRMRINPKREEPTYILKAQNN